MKKLTRKQTSAIVGGQACGEDSYCRKNYYCCTIGMRCLALTQICND
ncbi:hypothetical protein [Elizabethkingia miricola]|uniref:Bacteriocin n=1 Tax=Elizabethkingia miricola TaxID=172045 RepID=A0ABD5B9D0_ELIMR|nr:hypothetical protein [Elizabethkingia miricola]